MTASEIAIEHILWCSQEGLTPREVLTSINILWPGDRAPDWHDAELALSLTHQRLCPDDARDERLLDLMLGAVA